MKTSQTLNKQQRKLILYAQNFLCADDTITANIFDGGTITIKCYTSENYDMDGIIYLDVITRNGLLTYKHTNAKGWKLSYDGGN